MSMQPGSYPYQRVDSGTEFLYSGGPTLNLKNVWESNLDEEMFKLMSSIEKYPYIAMVENG